jgi:hypothetical protein
MMAKGQKRSNREIKKPKAADKLKAAPSAPLFGSMQSKATPDKRRPGKKG